MRKKQTSTTACIISCAVPANRRSYSCTVSLFHDALFRGSIALIAKPKEATHQVVIMKGGVFLVCGCDYRLVLFVMLMLIDLYLSHTHGQVANRKIAIKFPQL